jgi:hypothetical protein
MPGRLAWRFLDSPFSRHYKSFGNLKPHRWLAGLEEAAAAPPRVGF